MPDFFDWLASLPEAHPELRLGLLGGLLLAALLGGAIGWERAYSGKPAGLRTNILICMAATLLTDLSVLAAASSAAGDPGRIAAQIVTGVGFLGAGTIIQSRGNVTGLTTAATLWIVSAIGMAIGFGAWVEAVGTTLLVLVALVPLRRVERVAQLRPDDDDSPAEPTSP
ncbi:MAG TPA: MgtC/SapB family protein [Longimicrobiales bacterium]|nr:MgtC/SapB family protein [Longimicrobiales bacterium]